MEEREYGEPFGQDGCGDRCAKVPRINHDEGIAEATRAWRLGVPITFPWRNTRAKDAMPPSKTPEDVLTLTVRNYFNREGGRGVTELTNMQDFALEKGPALCYAADTLVHSGEIPSGGSPVALLLDQAMRLIYWSLQLYFPWLSLPTLRWT